MQGHMFFYEKFRLVRIVIAKGEIHGPETNQTFSNHIGTIYNYGEIEIIPPSTPAKYLGIIGNRPDCFDCTPYDLAEDTNLYYRANSDTEWWCFSYYPNRTQETITLDYLEVKDRATIEPGVGFVVLSGQVSAGNILAQMDNYFRPRDYPVTVTGHARLALLRFEAAE